MSPSPGWFHSASTQPQSPCTGSPHTPEASSVSFGGWGRALFLSMSCSFSYIHGSTLVSPYASLIPSSWKGSVCVFQRDRSPIVSSPGSSLTPCVTLDNLPSISGPFCKIKIPASSDAGIGLGGGMSLGASPSHLAWNPQPDSLPHSATHLCLGFPDHSQC